MQMPPKSDGERRGDFVASGQAIALWLLVSRGVAAMLPVM
jgi:hypothetical protein